jgi:single-strand DNA-binding protein
VNNCNFIGRVGKDAVTRYSQGGKPVTGWSLAVDTGLGQNKTTIWLDCTLWGERGEKVAQYITKGSQVGVTGELGTREHDGKTYVTLRVDNVSLIGGRGDGDSKPDKPAARTQQRQQTPEPSTGSDFKDDDIPFN